MNPEFVILEGSDGTGKSTLAGVYAKLHGYDVIHKSAPTTKFFDTEYYFPLLKGSKAVLDRWHIGEAIWPAVFGRESLYDSVGDLTLVHNAILKLGAAVFILVRPERGIVQELERRGEPDEAIEAAILGQRSYLDLVGIVGLPGVVVTDMFTAGRLLGVADRDLRDVHGGLAE